MKRVLEVRFFASSSGNEPVLDWLRDLSATDRKSIGEDIKTEQYGWPLGMPLVRSLGGGIWEARIRLENRISRVLFALEGAPWCCCMALSKSSKQRLRPISHWRVIA